LRDWEILPGHKGHPKHSLRRMGKLRIYECASLGYKYAC
jgi:hypothetical protein